MPASKVTSSGAATRSMMASKGTRAAVPCKRPLLGFDDGAQTSHRGLVDRVDGMEHGCAPLSEALVFKRCRHQSSPLCTPFGPASSAIAVGLEKSVRSEKCLFFKWLMQSAKLLQVLKQKPTRLSANNMKRYSTLFEPSEFDWGEAELSGYGRNGCAGIGVIAR